MQGLFVTGTDTGVGKTFVTCALARRARARGKRVFAFKPVETGCPHGRLGEDQEKLIEAAGGWQEGELRGVYQLGLPAAPLVAAEVEGRSIDLGRIDTVLKRGSEGAGLVLVEGAGGLRVPITPEVDMAGLAARIGFPVVVVARAGLGTINHSLLTLETVERERLRIRGLVLSRRPEDIELVESNVEQIGRRWPGRIVVFDGDLESLDPILESD
jgi:dethiobiotin synthetase